MAMEETLGTAIVELDADFKQLEKAMEDLEKIMSRSMKDIEKIVNKEMKSITRAFEDGMDDANKTVKDGMGDADKAMRSGMDDMEDSTSRGMADVEDAIESGMGDAERAMSNSMDDMERAVDNGMSDVERAMQSGMNNTERTVENGMSDIERAMQDGMDDSERVIDRGMGDIEGAMRNGMDDTERTVDRGMADVEDAFQSGFRDVERQVDRSMDDVNDTMDDSMQDMQGTVETAVAAIGAAFIGIGAAATAGAFEADDAMTQIKIGLGETGEASEETMEKARDLWRKGFGEDLVNAANNVVIAERALAQLNEQDLATVIEGATILEQKLGEDYAQTIMTVDNMTETFGITGEEAMDLIVKGMQDGLNASDDLLDTLNEYSPNFENIGLSAEDFYNILKEGSEVGVRNMDDLGDMVREFGIRMQDNSDTTREALQSMNLDADELIEAFNRGGEDGRAAFIKILEAINQIEDPVKRNQVAVDLLGTKYEDVGDISIDALLGIQNETVNTAGATEQMISDVEQSTSTRWAAVWREMKEALEPVGEALVTLAEENLPAFQKAFEGVAEIMKAFAGDSESTAANLTAMGIAMAGVVAAGTKLVQWGGALLTFTGVAGLFASISNAWEQMTSKGDKLTKRLADLWKGMRSVSNYGTVTRGVIAALAFAFNPWVLAIGAVVAALAILYVKNEEFRNFVHGVWDGIQAKFKEVMDFLGPYIQEAMTAIQTFFQSKLAEIQAFWQEHGDSIIAIVKGAWDIIKGIFDFMLPIITTILKVAFEVIKFIVVGVWDAICNIIDGAFNVIKGLVQIFIGIFTLDFKTFWEGIKNLFSGALELIWGLINLYFLGKLIKLVGSFITLGKNLFTGFWTSIKNIFTGSLTSIQNFMVNTFNFFKSLIDDTMRVMSGTFKTVWDVIKGIFTTTLNAIRAFMANIWSGISTATSAAWNAIRTGLSTIWNGIKTNVSTVFTAMKNIISTIWTGIKTVTSTIWNALKNIVMTPVNWITTAVKNAWSGLGKFVSGIWDGIKLAIVGSINGVINVINRFINFINGLDISVDVPDWVPKIGGKKYTIGFPNIPNIPMLAKGGFATGPTLAMIGEGRHDEAVVPLSDKVFKKLAEGINEKGGTNGGGVTQHITTQASPSDIQRYTERAMRKIAWGL